uniref:Uncharacterized protein n=1 Tax=mine drainage metagenome TaxID=410659 RepID=E6QJF0_9ZZZZ
MGESVVMVSEKVVDRLALWCHVDHEVTLMRFVVE